jgi:ATP-dependent helicase Lhr and Lhr-like helicase
VIAGCGRIGLSATAGDLSAVADFLRPGAGNAVSVITDTDSRSSIKTVHGVIDDGDGEGAVVQWLYENLRGTNNLVFANRRADVESYADALREVCSTAGVRPEFEAHHGSLSRQHREDVERLLKHSPESTTVVASSTLELGIDIGRIERVVQIGAPPSVASLQQRLGRSGRRGEPPVLDAFVLAPALDGAVALEDRLRAELVQTVADIELMNRRWYEPPVASARHFSTLVQQVLSYVSQTSGVTAEEAFDVLCSGKGPFATATGGLFYALVEHLIKSELLYRYESGLLVLGNRGEKLVAGQSFFAAFASTVDYSVIAEDRILGSLPLTDAIEIGGCITFAARRWSIRRIDDDRKKIYVEPTEEGDAARFLGSSIMVHDEVRREMLRTYLSDTIPSYIDDTAAILLKEGRDSFTQLGLATQRVLPVGRDTVILPWVGDRTMNTMRLQLLTLGFGVKKSAMTLSLPKCSPARLKDAVPILQRDDRPPEALAKHVRMLRVHKHHSRLPVDLLAIDYASEFLDVPAAAQAWTAIAESL